jgi:NADPH-dependent glutamate synthase beta subunit-like oxidoreductase
MAADLPRLDRTRRGGERLYAVSTERFSGDASGNVRALHAVKVEMVKKDPSTALGGRRPCRVRARGR